MRILPTLLFLLALPSQLLGQTPSAELVKPPVATATQASPSAAGLKFDAVLNPTGCPGRPASLFAHDHRNVVYRLISKGLEGERTDRGVRIVGGLAPTATLAAQAGSWAPAFRAQYWTTPNEAGRNDRLIEMAVTHTISAAPGSCSTP